MKKARFSEMLVRAAMNIYEWNTGVIRSTDKLGRICITPAIDDTWGDCICLMYRPEKETRPGLWFTIGHFSPARARLIAEQLIQRATLIEKREKALNIDKSNFPEGVIT